MMSPRPITVLAAIPLLVAAMLAAANAAPAAQPSAPPGGPTWEHFTCSNCVSALTVTDDAVWTGTAGSGVLRWARDGSYTHFTTDDGLPTDWIYDIAVDRAGTVWVGGADGGLIRYDGSDWSSREQFAHGGQSIQVETVRDIALGAGGEAWLVVGAGSIDQDAGRNNTLHFDGTDWRFGWLRAPGGHHVNTVRIDAQGRPWFGTHGGLVRLDGGRETVWTYDDGLGADYVHEIAFADGTPWAAVAARPPRYGESGVGRFDGPRWRHFGARDGLADTFVSDIGVAGPDELWFAHSGVWPNRRETPPVGAPAGATRFTAGRLTAADEGDGLPFADIARIEPDPRGGLWFAGATAGIGHRADDGWTYRLADDGPVGLESRAVAISPLDGALWTVDHVLRTVVPISGDRQNVGVGLSRYDGTRWSHIPTRDGYPGDAVNAMAFDGIGVLWLATTADGALSFDGGGWTRHTATAGFVDGGVADVVRDAEDRLWFATADGVRQRQAGGWKRHDTADGMSDEDVQALAAGADGSVWAATADGLDRYDDPGWSTVAYPSGWLDTVTAAAVDLDGAVWLASRDTSQHRAALGRYRDGAWTVLPLDGRSGRPDSWRVTAIDVAANGDLWLTDALGALRYDGATWTRTVLARDNNGLAVLGWDLVALPDGRVWFGHKRGVSLFHGPAPTPTPTPPATVTPRPTTATPAPGDARPSCVCDDVLRWVPTVVISDALANPLGYDGWLERLDPGKPPGPANPRRQCLTLRNRGTDYHPLWNPPVWRVGCP